MITDKPVKILFLCNAPAVPAGVEKTVLMLLRHIDPARFTLTFALNGTGPFYDQLLAAGASPQVIHSSGRYTVAWHRQLRELVTTIQPAVVQLHLSRLNVPLLRSYGAAVVERLNMTRHQSFRYPLQWRWLDVFSARYINRFVVVSESLKAEFVERGYDAARLDVVHNGIDVPNAVAAADLHRELNLDPECILIGTVSRLTPQKGVDTAIKGFAMIARNDAKLRMIIAGDGERRTDLKRLSDELGVGDRVRFIGFRADALNVIAALDVMLVPSRWEPFANSILEAMALGTPVVATNVGGNKEAIDDRRNGLLIPVDSPEAAAKAVATLLNDIDVKQRLIAAAKQRSHDFSVSQMARGHERVYDALAHRRAGQPLTHTNGIK